MTGIDYFAWFVFIVIIISALDMFEGVDADPALVDLLRRALGSREDMDIKWSR